MTGCGAPSIVGVTGSTTEGRLGGESDGGEFVDSSRLRFGGGECHVDTLSFISIDR